MDYTKFEDEVTTNIEENWLCTRSDAQSLVETASLLMKHCYDNGYSAMLTANKIMQQ
jgi:hypothetical protein